MSQSAVRTLNHLAVGSKARITGFQKEDNDPSTEMLTRRLKELGFIEHTLVEVLHVAPFSKDPIAVTARGGTFALRRNEASLIHIEEVQK